MPNRLVARMCLMYGPPEPPNPEAWFAEMDRLVKSYSGRELDAAADLVLRTHKRRGFPSVSDMLTACEDARDELAPRPVANKSTYVAWSKERIAQADRLIRCAMGRKAASDGWIFALHSFARDAGRLPNQHKISGVMRTARQFDEAYRDCANGNGGIAGDALLRLGNSMLDRRDELARMAGDDVT